MTQLFRSVTPDQQIELCSITSAADDGKYHAKLKVYYDPAKLVIKDDYSPTSCMEAALSIDEDKTDGSYKCTKMAGGLQPDAGNSTNGEDLCVKLNSLHVCESQLVQSGSSFGITVSFIVE